MAEPEQERWHVEEYDSDLDEAPEGTADDCDGGEQEDLGEVED